MVPSGEKLVFLSINRYERKKNLALAIKAFGKIADCMLYFVNGTVDSCFCFFGFWHRKHGTVVPGHEPENQGLCMLYSVNRTVDPCFLH